MFPNVDNKTSNIEYNKKDPKKSRKILKNVKQKLQDKREVRNNNNTLNLEMTNPNFMNKNNNTTM